MHVYTYIYIYIYWYIIHNNVGKYILLYLYYKIRIAKCRTIMFILLINNNLFIFCLVNILIFLYFLFEKIYIY